jgi:uncharacterized protein with HEPN domain
MTRHDNKVYLNHIIDSINKIDSYIGSNTFNKFILNEMLVDAVHRNFEIIGEACNKLGDNFKSEHAKIDFRSATNIRNRLIHGYDDVDLEIVWNTIKQDLPKMKKEIKKILN